MEIRARAPLRLSFVGGGTDVEPFASTYGGAVLSATIDRYVYCTVSDVPGPSCSLAFDPSVDLAPRDFDLTLVDGVRRLFGVGDVRVVVESDTPAGSGLGSSSAAVVAVVKALSEFAGERLSRYELAATSIRVEREILGIPGGYQDQYAAAFGGFNVMRFDGGQAAEVEPLRLERSVVRDLEYALVLVYSGTVDTHFHIIDDQQRRYGGPGSASHQALSRMKELVPTVLSCLNRHDVDSIGELLLEDWRLKRTLSPHISNPAVDALIEGLLASGGRGAKLLGAGGGGYVLCLAEAGCRAQVQHAAMQGGGRPVPFRFEEEGAVAWRPITQLQASASRGG